MEVELHTDVKQGARRLLLASTTVGVLVAAAAPGGAMAAAGNNVCAGHVTKASATQPDGSATPANQIEYRFGCTDPITAFSLISPREISGFATDILVYDAAGTLIPDEAFNCEGDLPGFGVNCNGTYRGHFHTAQGTYQLSMPVCSVPRGKVQLVVSYASADAKGKVTNAMAGPFDLGKPRGCPPVKSQTSKATRKTTKKGVKRAGKH